MRNENRISGLISVIILIFLFSILILVSLYLIKTMVLVSIPVTVQATNIGLSRLQQINQTYGNDPLMQIIISQAQNTIIEIFNSQISTAIQNVNEIERIFDFFHNLSSIKDLLEIFSIPLILIIIIIYIYKHHKNSYL